jgi:CheY-like chemotaxis protein
LACTGGYVLIVDDDVSILQTLAEIVGGDYGHNVKTAADGLEALEILSASPAPALIVLDLMMPRVDGVELMKRRNDHPVWALVPVCIMTASKNEHSELSRLAGADESRCSVLSKPFDMDALMAIVARYC